MSAMERSATGSIVRPLTSTASTLLPDQQGCQKGGFVSLGEEPGLVAFCCMDHRVEEPGQPAVAWWISAAVKEFCSAFLSSKSPSL